MGSGFLFRRNPRRAAYENFSVAPVSEAAAETLPEGSSFFSAPAGLVPRLAAYQHFRVASSEEAASAGDLPEGSVFQAQVRRRPSIWKYWSPSYYRFFSIKTGGSDLVEVADGESFFSQPPRAFRRAGISSYWLVQPQIPEDPEGEALPEASSLLSQPPRIFRRTSRHIYWLDNITTATNQLEDPTPGDSHLMLDRPRLGKHFYPRARAAQDAYWLKQFHVVDDVAQAETDAKPKLSQPQAGRRRADRTSYWLDQFIQQLSDPTDGLQGHVSLAGIRKFRRTANSAYWLDNLLPTPEAEPLPDGVRLLGQPPRIFRRTSRQAYWLENWLAVVAEDETLDTSTETSSTCDYYRPGPDEDVYLRAPGVEESTSQRQGQDDDIYERRQRPCP